MRGARQKIGGEEQIAQEFICPLVQADCHGRTNPKFTLPHQLPNKRATWRRKRSDAWQAKEHAYVHGGMFRDRLNPRTEHLEIIEVKYAPIPMDPFREPLRSWTAKR
jgi:hypothetical protein